ncbi:MAG: hypothetical protein ACLR4X_11780 [Clostridia bacterium]
MKLGVMDLYESYEVVIEDILDAVKYTEERNSNFNSEFLDKIVDFLETRKDCVNRLNQRERYYNRMRNLEK